MEYDERIYLIGGYFDGGWIISRKDIKRVLLPYPILNRVLTQDEMKTMIRVKENGFSADTCYGNCAYVRKDGTNKFYYESNKR